MSLSNAKKLERVNDALDRTVEALGKLIAALVAYRKEKLAQGLTMHRNALQAYKAHLNSEAGK